MVTKQDVFELLESLGIRSENHVTVHTSLKAIGEIDGGAEGLLDALRQYLCDGLLIVPTHTWAGIVERRYYDPVETPPCIGVLPTIAAFHPEAVRSLHPTHSVAVFGKKAKEYVACEKTYTTATPPDNCLTRLYQERGKILLLGVGFESNTYIHAVEEQLNIPNRFSEETLNITIKADGGEMLQTDYRWHSVKGLVYGISEHYHILEKPLYHMGAVTYGKLGNAKVICCDAVKTTQAYAHLWAQMQYDFCLENKEIPEECYLGVKPEGEAHG